MAQGLSYNVSKLHEFLFGEKDYGPSETVQTVSDYLEIYSGVPTVKLDEDMEDTTGESTDRKSVV